MVVLIFGRILVSSSYALLFLKILVCTHGIAARFVFSDGDMGSFQVLNVDNVVNTFSSVSADILSFRVDQLLLWLNCEVLTLNSLFEFFSLTVPLV